MGNVREFTMTNLWSQDRFAVVEDVTNFQSGPRQTPRKSQSNHEVWFGMRSTGPGERSASSLKARKRNRSRTRRRRREVMGGGGLR